MRLLLVRTAQLPAAATPQTKCRARRALIVDDNDDGVQRLAALCNNDIPVTGGRSGQDAKYIAAVKERYSGPVVVAHDLMEF
ncbi:MAG TPA: hypothetical protein VG994_14070 [Steroidobacteraceae bacterium]|nr:hypothetical protein [Steroidobacteraceae bacterium]